MPEVTRRARRSRLATSETIHGVSFLSSFFLAPLVSKEKRQAIKTDEMGNPFCISEMYVFMQAVEAPALTAYPTF